MAGVDAVGGQDDDAVVDRCGDGAPVRVDGCHVTALSVADIELVVVAEDDDVVAALEHVVAAPELRPVEQDAGCDVLLGEPVEGSCFGSPVGVDDGVRTVEHSRLPEGDGDAAGIAAEAGRDDGSMLAVGGEGKVGVSRRGAGPGLGVPSRSLVVGSGSA